MRLVVLRSAETQIREASEWWYENREGADGVFRSELSRAFRLVLRFPRSGALATHAELPGVRRILMPRTSYYLYYHLVDEHTVEVLALWHTSRGEEAPV